MAPGDLVAVAARLFCSVRAVRRAASRRTQPSNAECRLHPGHGARRACRHHVACPCPPRVAGRLVGRRGLFVYGIRRDAVMAAPHVAIRLSADGGDGRRADGVAAVCHRSVADGRMATALGDLCGVGACHVPHHATRRRHGAGGCCVRSSGAAAKHHRQYDARSASLLSERVERAATGAAARAGARARHRGRARCEHPASGTRQMACAAWGLASACGDDPLLDRPTRPLACHRRAADQSATAARRQRRAGHRAGALWHTDHGEVGMALRRSA